jgi:2,3-bisphosphoglycerate-dependent phosphoglycerate mutase
MADHEWPLSHQGRVQAEKLAGLLRPLKIEKVFSSPYLRCGKTLQPFLEASGIAPVVDHEFRERTISLELRVDFREIWTRSWDDFSFALPGCEPSNDAQSRFVGAVKQAATQDVGIVAICTHGNVIGLLMNHVEPQWGREATDRLRNPDVLKLNVSGSEFVWDRAFRLEGLDEIASGYHETPIDW